MQNALREWRGGVRDTIAFAEMSYKPMYQTVLNSLTNLEQNNPAEWTTMMEKYKLEL